MWHFRIVGNVLFNRFGTISYLEKKKDEFFSHPLYQNKNSE